MLYLLSNFFKFLVFVKNYLYDNAYFSNKKLSVPVISVGNLSMGGAGKTPLVDYLIKFLLEKKKKVAVLSRGYGRQSRGIQFLSHGRKNPAVFFGDEAFMLYSKYDISYAVGRNRWEAGRQLLSKEAVDCIVLDDAFQHRQLFRNLNIVLLDVSRGEDFYRPFPQGGLREGFSSLKRADIILFTKINLVSADKLQQFKNRLNKLCCLSGMLTCDLEYDLSGFVSKDKRGVNNNKSVVLLSGIASPETFEKNIQNKKFTIIKHFIYKDHVVYTADDVNKVLSYCLKQGVEQIICTEKDWHKLKEFSQWKNLLFYATLEVKFVTNESLFLKRLEVL